MTHAVAAAALGTMLCARIAGAQEPRADGNATPAAGPERGARLEVSGFEYRRALSEVSAGLVTLQLDAAVLSHSRGPDRGFADVRIVDEAGYQIPYLVERREVRLSSDLTIRKAGRETRLLREPSERNRSLHAIDLPYANLPDPRLVLETSDRIFSRALRVGIERPPDRLHRDAWLDVLALADWRHADPDTPPRPIEIDIRPGDGTRLLLVVEEGDNRPLPLTAVRLSLPSWRLRFFRPPGPVYLLYGSAEAPAPQYDLRLLATTVMGAEAREITAAPEAPAAAAQVAWLSPLIFWAGLSFAVLILLGLIVRLISDGARTPPSPPAP
jgi:hypothetical protein